MWVLQYRLCISSSIHIQCLSLPSLSAYNLVQGAPCCPAMQAYEILETDLCAKSSLHKCLFLDQKKKQIYSQGLKYKVACCTKLLCCQDTGGVSRNRTLALLKPLMEFSKFSVFDVLFWWILKSLLGTLFLAAEAWSVVVTVGGGER